MFTKAQLNYNILSNLAGLIIQTSKSLQFKSKFPIIVQQNKFY